MKRQSTIFASSEARARRAKKMQSIKASHSTAEMLDAFEDKLAEFGIESSTKVCSDEETEYDIESCDAIMSSTGDPEMDKIMSKEREVEIYDEDYRDFYTDSAGGFGVDGVNYSLADMKNYWNQNSLGDPSLAYYNSFEDWWNDTRSNFLTKFEAGTDVVTAAKELSDEELDVVYGIADEYNVTSPVSGDWDTETEHEQNVIAEALGVSLEDAKEIMIKYLGFSEDMF